MRVCLSMHEVLNNFRAHSILLLSTVDSEKAEFSESNDDDVSLSVSRSAFVPWCSRGRGGLI